MIKSRNQKVTSRAPNGAPFAWLVAHRDHGGDDCLPWPFGRKPGGYGQLFHEGKNVGAHRLMCELVHGQPPANARAASHTCGKGHEGCVNPKHLVWKTPRENQADRLIHGTHLWGERHPQSRLTNGEVIAIIALRGKLPVAQVAQLFGTTPHNVSSIQMRASWRDVGKALMLG